MEGSLFKMVCLWKVKFYRNAERSECYTTYYYRNCTKGL